MGQTPNQDSRVYLGTRLDVLGDARAGCGLAVTALDHTGLDALQRSLTNAFMAAGLGRLNFGSKPLTLDEMMDASHHMGTTRMAADSSEGVVDRHCRVSAPRISTLRAVRFSRPHMAIRPPTRSSRSRDVWVTAS